MTVAAVVLPPTAQQALSDSAGRPAVRRIVDSAWAGGAMPIVVVCEDPDGAVSTAVAGSPALLVDPSGQGDAAADYGLGVRAALSAVKECSAALLWPGRMVWVDPETVTSLIELHGRERSRSVRPSHEGTAGWPLLLPANDSGDVGDSALQVALDEAPDGHILLELGDPGSVLGDDVSLEGLPGYEGPPGPVAGPPPEWGAAAADEPDPEVVAADPTTP